MNIKEILQSKKFKHVLFILVCAVILILIFQAGVMVGFKKAGFLSNTGDNFFRHFGGPGRSNGVGKAPGGFDGAFNGMMRDEFPGGHGAGGKIVSVNLPNFTIIGNDNVEKVVNISADTKIMRFREEIKPEDLKVDDQAVILGVPATSSAIISAKLIRIMPKF